MGITFPPNPILNMHKNSILMACVVAGSLTSSLPAAVTLLGHYGLGEAGTVTGTTSPFIPLIDDVGTPNNITAQQSIGSTASIGTVGVAASGSTAYLQKTSGNSGWHSGAGYNLTSNWAIQIWMRPDIGTGTVQFQTDNSTAGVSIWFQSGAAGSDIAFGNGSGGTANETTNDTNYTTGTWYRIGIVNFNGTNHYYVNGAEVATNSLGGTLNNPMIGFAQGGLNGGAGGYDELKVWSFDHAADSLTSVTDAMNAVPEPSVAVLSGLGIFALLRRRRG